MDPKQRNALALAVIALLVIGSWVLFWPPQAKITQGLDIQGGLSVILTARETSSTAVTNDVMDRAEIIVRNRVDRLGASEVSIQRQGADSILVQMPGLKNADEALQVLGSTGQLEFVDVASINDTTAVAAIQSGQDKVKLKDGTYTPFMTGDVVTNAVISTDSKTNQLTVDLSMNPEGTKIWADYTTSHVNQLVAIVLDGIIQSAPSVNEPILGGSTSISGKFTPAEAKNLKTVLQTGALPVTLEFSESRVVGPTLGQDSLRQGVLAAGVGLLLVALYLIVFYRGLGVLAVSALVVFALVFMGILAALSSFGAFALSLPGIAGIVLTIGLAADSSILILERFREEVRMGRSVRQAAKSGSLHAIWTSVDADLVTFVSAMMLFSVAIGPVRGFALTLMIGIGCDIAMMILYKRPALMFLAENVLAKAPGFWGIPKVVHVEQAPATKGGGARA
ncbi:MAG: protein translocase subunit SecD [Actinobacteria bacterium]|nr:protein translocase subunit SecD [Actinomycetota bacterium]MCG2808644.1 protein translocase subunit SecD [Coriobacteriia bacterium]